MENKTFGKNYSNKYDLFYEKKDYEKECDFLEELFRKYKLDPKSILDLGCGTGGHVLPLARRGYKMAGLDLSEHMLEIAQDKLKSESLEADLRQGNIIEYDFDQKYDSVISMFAVYSYVTQNEDLLSSFKCAKKHLKPGGAFIFDCWNGPAVYKHRPLQRHTKIVREDEEVFRLTNPILDIENHVVETNFEFLYLKNNELVGREKEQHMTRFFFPQGLRQLLNSAGFDQVYFCPFLKTDSKIDDDCWYLTTIAFNSESK